MDYLLESDYLYDQGQIEILSIALESAQYVQEDVKSVAKKAWGFAISKLKEIIEFIKDLFTKKIPELFNKIKNGKIKNTRLRKRFDKGKKIKVDVTYEYITPRGIGLCKEMVNTTKNTLSIFAEFVNKVDKYNYNSNEEFEEDHKKFKIKFSGIGNFENLVPGKRTFDEKDYYRAVDLNYIDKKHFENIEKDLDEAEKLLKLAKSNYDNVLSTLENAEKLCKKWEKEDEKNSEDSKANNRINAAMSITNISSNIKFYALKPVELVSKQIALCNKNISIIEKYVGNLRPLQGVNINKVNKTELNRNEPHYINL
jgi:hypothetical protein